MLKNKEFSCFKTQRSCIYPANKFLNSKNCWHFNIYEQDKISLSAELSMKKSGLLICGSLFLIYLAHMLL